MTFSEVSPMGLLCKDALFHLDLTKLTQTNSVWWKNLFGIFEMFISSLIGKTNPVIKNLTPFVVDFLRSRSIPEYSFILCA